MVFHSHFRTLAFGIAGVHCYCSGAALDLDLYLVEVARVAAARLHRAHLHLVTAPALYLHRSIYVFEDEASAGRQGINLMKIFVSCKAGKCKTSGSRQQKKRAERDSDNP
jgi:hypothetical protein